MSPRREINDEPARADFALPQVLAALGEPIRLAIVTQLASAKKELSCGSIELPVHPSTATHHFTILRQAGILHQFYVGTSRMNTLRMEDMEAAFPGLLPSVIGAAKHTR